MADVSPAEVGYYFAIFFAPLVPGGGTLLQYLQVFFVRHCYCLNLPFRLPCKSLYQRLI